MALDVSMFLASKAAPVKETTYVVSDRFVDADGKPIPWVLRPVSSAKDKELKQACTNNGHFDNGKYAEMLTAESVVDPNLADATLQDSYHVYGKTELLEQMLYAGEMNKLQLKALAINGMATPLDDLVGEAKN
nr:MAG TPA: tail assembly chaperone protein [Caudoviricetes sp.]